MARTAPDRGPMARLLALGAGSAACFYVVWNVAWLAQGRLPPSILQELTGIPVGTTGLGRSCLAALRGDLLTSVAWNAFTLPIAVLVAASLVQVARCVRDGRRLVLPRWMGHAWLGVLATAWLVKLVQGPMWW